MKLIFAEERQVAVVMVIKNIKLRIYSKIVSISDKVLVFFRKHKLNNRDFSIICNNCWGGYVYRRYGIPYLTPTVGTYFFAEDFVKLCGDLRKYMDSQLEFISWDESKYKDKLLERRQTSVPIARLWDIEIIFLHYKSEEEAREKWSRRVKRINYDNLIFKFSKMNLCTEAELLAFDRLECKKKICFVPPEEANLISCGIPFRSALGKTEIANETMEYARYINLNRMINAKQVCGNHME